MIAPGQEDHPIVRGIAPGSIFGPTDVYEVRLPLPGDSQPIVLGKVLEGMNPGNVKERIDEGVRIGSAGRGGQEIAEIGRKHSGRTMPW